ncbi:BgTH12-02541 [Blumeria graminis f. sp. triticale]|uniref:ATP phosphoribosyltransferase n=1 Tax=Blumeria graminis f. sp. triticale TaxID=1689686 RepID=A0A9W4D1B9_BLUGR|nr:BgTH12-02541 [Blumeria graminis f. sp. triticale]
MGFQLTHSSLEGRLLFAVPKKGRLLQATLDLLKGADIKFRRENRLDIALVVNHPIALVFLPAADIPTFVGEGRVSLGITGQDTVAEHASSLLKQRKIRQESLNVSQSDYDDGFGCEEIMDLGFGTCKLQVQVPEKGEYVKSSDLIGKNIGTSFVHLAEDYFLKLESEATEKDEKDPKSSLKTKIIELSGSVEAACALGVADGIIDLVESGETMKAAGLKAVDTVVSSTAVLIKSRNSSNNQLIDMIASRIRGVITAQRFVLCQYNMERAILDSALKITPGKRAPTINALEEEGWVAVSAMVEKKEIATIMDQLAKVGATDILILNIVNSRGI